jgi:hypothetical protein
MISIVESANLVGSLPTYVGHNKVAAVITPARRDDHHRIAFARSSSQPIDHWVNASWLTGICLQYAGNLLPDEVIIFE